MALDKLRQQVATLKQQAEQFDKAKLFSKNRYMQAQPSLFDRAVFSTKSMNLADYVIEIEDEISRLPPSEHRHAYTYALERIGAQVQAVFNVIKSTPIWVKENKSHYKPRPKQTVYKQAVQKIMAGRGPVRGNISINCSATSKPVSPGISISSKTKSALCWRNQSNAAWPFPASATIS